ncbi:hypothetical protein EC968_008458 [Mortierella alpina]|nr:hypothetical protein EC968_008458 [Mortierella alpina]
MGNVSSKPSNGSSFSTPASPAAGTSSSALPPTRASFSVESRSPREKVQQHQRSYSYSARPFVPRSQHSDSGNSSGKSHNEKLALDAAAGKESTATQSALEEGGKAAFLEKPLPTSPLPSALQSTPDNDSMEGRQAETAFDSNRICSPSAPTTTAATPPLSSAQRNCISPSISTRMVTSLTQQSIHSQSSLSDKSTKSGSSGTSGSSGSGSGSGSGNGSGSGRTVTTRTTSLAGTTTESLGQLSLQRFPTGESEYKVRPLSRSKAAEESSRPGQGLGQNEQEKSSRAASMASSSSARSSSGSSGFRFPKPNLFKPLMYSQANDSKNQQHLYHHHGNSNSASALSSGHRQQQPQQQSAVDPFANSPFPSILLTIELPQSLLDRYVIDQEAFRHGKGIWGIGRYSWTITVLARANGKKYVIKRVSKALLPPSAYYHYPTTAHQLCTCPACKSSREQLLLAGQLDQKEMENIQEVLVLQNKGRKKELPQLPPSSPQQPSRERQQPTRPLSVHSLSPPVLKDTKEPRKSLNLYNCNNASTPNTQVKIASLSSNSTPQDTPVNSRPSTPSSPLRPLFSTSPPTVPVNTGKAHNRSSSHSTSKIPPSSNPSAPAPLQPSATPHFWPNSECDPLVTQPRAWLSTDVPRPEAGDSPFRPPPMSAGVAAGHKKRPNLQRHASTPNMSRAVTGLNVLEVDPMRANQLKQLARDSRTDWHPRGPKGQRPHTTVSVVPTTTMPRQSMDSADYAGTENMKKGSANEGRAEPSVTWSEPFVDRERRVSPFDTNEGEFKQMEPEAPSIMTSKPNGGSAVQPSFVPPPHALPMELVLLQTYNDSDRLPEHHEWTQDQEYWYYVTKAHGVRRRKLKKVSSWWLDMGSLGSALLSGSSSSSEPIATGPIYNMGRGTSGTTSPLLSSPLSSEVVLANHDVNSGESENGNQVDLATKELGSTTTTTGASVSFATFKRQSSPRNSSHMGKYYHVDWDEYTSL